MTDNTTMTIGLNKTVITPQKPLYLAGFGHRVGTFENVAQNIYVRTAIFDDQLALISGDLLWWGDNMVQAIKNQLANDATTKHLKIVLTATHSHSGPITSDYMSPMLGLYDDEYNQFLLQQVVKSVQQALDNQQTVHGTSKHYSTCDFAIHRRRLNDQGKIDMAPNYDYELDNTVPIVCFYNAQKEPILIINKFDCHPTISDANSVSGEYPGMVSEHLENTYPKSIAMVLQGFAADIRPAMIKDDAFYRGSFADIQRLGQTMGQKIADVIKQEAQSIQANPSSNHIEIIEQDVALPVETYNQDQLQELAKNSDGIIQEWANYWLDQGAMPDTATLKLAYYNINDCLKIVAIGGEVVNAYQKFIKQQFGDDVWGVAYANGLLSYIPTAKQIDEGGYEPHDSAYYFYLSGFLNKQVEPILQQQITQVMELN